MTERKESKMPLQGLRQAMADDIMEASDEEILAQFAEDVGSPEENAVRMRALFEKTVLLANKGRLQAARAGAAAGKVSRSASPSRSAKRALACVKSSTLTLTTIASPSRPGRKASYPTPTFWTCWKPSASSDCWNEGSALTPAEALLQELGITEPEEIELEAIAHHVGARVRFRPLCGCEAHILGCGRHAIITVKQDSSARRKRFSIAHELGHWRFHRGKALVCRVDEYRPRDTQSPEKVADTYAADLLMPRYLFAPRAAAIDRVSFGSIGQLAEAFKTSLTATAIRLVDLDQFPGFVVCHTLRGRKWFARAPRVPGTGILAKISTQKAPHSVFNSAIVQTTARLERSGRMPGSIVKALRGLWFASKRSASLATRP